MNQYLTLARSEPPAFVGEPTHDTINALFDHVCAANHPFVQQAAFMEACGQYIDKRAWGQAALYIDLVDEEFQELMHELYDEHGELATHAEINLANVAKEGVDLIVVTLGLLHSLGIDSVMAFELVQRSNEAKVDPATGQVRRREDGKILKPEGWTKPDMSAAV